MPVCLLVTIVSHAETAESIEMPFEAHSLGPKEPRPHITLGFESPTQKAAFGNICRYFFIE